jgi:hypothetical protein
MPHSMRGVDSCASAIKLQCAMWKATGWKVDVPGRGSGSAAGWLSAWDSGTPARLESSSAARAACCTPCKTAATRAEPVQSVCACDSNRSHRLAGGLNTQGWHHWRGDGEPPGRLRGAQLPAGSTCTRPPRRQRPERTPPAWLGCAPVDDSTLGSLAPELCPQAVGSFGLCMADHAALHLTSRMAQRTSTGRRRSSCSVPEVLTCSAGACGLLTSAWFLWRARAQEYWTRFAELHDCSRMAHQHIAGRRHKQLRAQLVLHCEGSRARERGRPLQWLDGARLA